MVAGTVIGGEKFAGTGVELVRGIGSRGPGEMGSKGAKGLRHPARSRSGVVGKGSDLPGEMWTGAGVERGAGREARSGVVGGSRDPPGEI